MRDKAIQLAEEPYRALDPTRLKLSGGVQWDCRPCLSDLFYLPFVEPRINEFEVQPPADLCPDMSSVVFSDVIGLCKVWDVRGLLRLFPFEDGPSDLRRCCKVFNNYKNASADRQIGDRRYQNFLEGRIPGPSRFLPSGASLLQVAPRRFEQRIVGCVADRKDFYHQYWITDERSTRNCVYHDVPWALVSDPRAAQVLVQRSSERRRQKGRDVVGDYLQQFQMTSPLQEGDSVAACFGALFQGDHLGVEIACDSHANLLSSVGLLRPGSTLQALGCPCR